MLYKYHSKLFYHKIIQKSTFYLTLDKNTFYVILIDVPSGRTTNKEHNLEMMEPIPFSLGLKLRLQYQVSLVD